MVLRGTLETCITVMCTLDLTRKKPKHTTKVVRDFRSVNCASFAADVSAQQSAQPVDPLNGFDAYHRAISAAVNDYAPSTTKTVRLDSRKPLTMRKSILRDYPDVS